MLKFLPKTAQEGIAIVVIVILLYTGCKLAFNKPEPATKEFSLFIHNGNQTYNRADLIECDSFKMRSDSICDFWSNGQMNTIIAEDFISPSTKKE